MSPFGLGVVVAKNRRQQKQISKPKLKIKGKSKTFPPQPISKILFCALQR